MKRALLVAPLILLLAGCAAAPTVKPLSISHGQREADYMSHAQTFLEGRGYDWTSDLMAQTANLGIDTCRALRGGHTLADAEALAPDDTTRRVVDLAAQYECPV